MAAGPLVEHRAPPAGPDPGGPFGRRGRAAAIAVMMLVATVLRLAGLGRESLWVDEGYTAYLARLTPLGYVDDVRHTVRNILPPLYFALMHYWTAVAGSSEVMLRLPSVVAGVLVVPLVHALMTRLFDPVTGLLGAGATTVSLFQLQYSQEARMYELLALLSVASLYLLVRLLDEGRTWQVTALAVTDALVVWTHHYGALLLVAEAGFVVVLALARDVDGRTLRRWLASRLVLGVLVLPWALFFVDQLDKVGAYPWLPPVTVGSVRGVLEHFAGSPGALGVCAALTLVGLVAHRGLPRRLLARRRLTPADRGYLLLWTAFAVPVLLAVGYSVVASPVFGRKYLIASSVAFLMLAVVGARALPGRLLPVAALVLVVAVSGPQYVHFYRDVNKDQWRESTAYLEANAAPGDLVLFNAGYTLQNGYGAYARRTDLETRPFPAGSEEFSLQPTRADLDTLAGLVAGRRHAWVVYSQSHDEGFTIAEELGALSTGGECTEFVAISVCRYDLPAG
ncbi:glycosyltransferase family 39 protein [Kineosporia sp. A_224]|uniref:glycosyltransferase family 39 protein n=1 Tax=Kineosporia sp. A_224 TaxID=1962180 RepID=UPI001304121C|nr:glycosyltransferase family 39 protein [Kineosporia sp. A_224]